MSLLLNYSLFSALTEFTLLTHSDHIVSSFLPPTVFPQILETSCHCVNLYALRLFFMTFPLNETYLNCCCSRVHGDGEMNATISQLICSSGDRLQTKGRMNRHTGSPQGKCDPQLCLQNPASELTLYMHFLDISLVLCFLSYLQIPRLASRI